VVMNRGYLRCGINGDLPGYNGRSNNIVDRQTASDVDIEQYKKDLDAGYTEEGVGFEPDFCRVVATGVFGDNKSRVLFKTLNTENRFSVLSDREVDIVIRNTTITSERDTNQKLNIDFGPVIYHDGQKILVYKDVINSLEQLENQEICTLENSTNSGNIEEEFNRRGIKFIPRYESLNGVQFTRNNHAMASFLFNECKAYTADETILFSLKRKTKSEDDLAIIPDSPFSYEPLAPHVLAGDSRWLEMVTYSIYVTIYAEQQGITKENIKVHDTTFGAPLTWSNMGMKQDNSARIIEYLGNYGEIYTRHLGQRERGRNNISTSGGLLISPPLK